ncbi:transmembrane amino acid transporter protein-domain-containing protein [Halteromyces radiatus]|uniref:transmembrane amino acid transporter protein-domain-containing protein n=1 Tax=Halteromyces radiatus TaxID=101107 RepID=UPI00221FA504|nr:transmembrane amino acid transporter protein-domain-containing protein [Halteromyces radiatus]KAI8098773.1 transmembrane amino acid transporter protein-domain-containing protein [Halteromyces radiatus]
MEQISSSLPTQIRVPTNTHPSQLPNYGTIQGGVTPLSENESLDLSLYHTQSQTGIHDSNRSIRSALSSFAGSYSRTSALYMADNLSLSRPATIDHAELEEEARRNDRKQRLDTESIFSNHTSAGLSFFPALSRHTTLGTMILRDEYHQDLQQQIHYIPQSSFLQSIFNSVNVLVGIGALALPLGIRYSGWLIGMSTFLFCTISTNYSAKVLARCLDAAPSGALTYADMGAAAFGERGRSVISGVFILELFTLGVAMAILLGDGLETLFDLDLITTRMISFCVLTPMTFLPISKLAYTSVIGVFSSAFLVLIVVLDGWTKPNQPGSLWDPMQTEWIPSEPFNIPLSFGLLMAVYSGHAVFPSLYRDMAEPKKYDRMVDVTYLITFTVYLVMAVTGYLMFGLDTMQEITQNLARTPGYNKWINQGAVYLIVLIPVAKYGLMLNPVNLSWELWLQSQNRVDAWCKDHVWKRHLLSIIGRIALSAFVIYIATVFPGFDRIMSLLGALFSFGISVIFPLACYHQLYHGSMTYKDLIINWTFLIISVILATLGTVWSCLP